MISKTYLDEIKGHKITFYLDSGIVIEGILGDIDGEECLISCCQVILPSGKVQSKANMLIERKAISGHDLPVDRKAILDKVESYESIFDDAKRYCRFYDKSFTKKSLKEYVQKFDMDTIEFWDWVERSILPLRD